MIACQNGQKADTDNTASATPVKACYAYTSAADTIQLTLLRNDTTVTGTLLYRLAEKDRNSGTFAGRMRGDTLVADYTFQSEGVESQREVAFLVSGDKLIEGFGPIEEKNGKAVRFSSLKSLTFSQTFPLLKVDCNE
ncbi:hypothetical protein [Fibrella forsythiae]|uniref:Uncharacterized protein n=1 Tax=Fibrella forsythiae TaxID=2817061 RepID=A0ABS3JAR8_9BACT|nr:hypothetical protein [Fibrella forsythiae]MBO0947092.1 hypothetical protein [Fibrella forsythiae]